MCFVSILAANVYRFYFCVACCSHNVVVMSILQYGMFVEYAHLQVQELELFILWLYVCSIYQLFKKNRMTLLIWWRDWHFVILVSFFRVSCISICFACQNVLLLVLMVVMLFVFVRFHHCMQSMTVTDGHAWQILQGFYSFVFIARKTASEQSVAWTKLQMSLWIWFMFWCCIW
jgi:uncharacterized membrane protein